MATTQQQSGPPYTQSTAQMGGLPLVVPDIPISASLMALFAVSAATHMTIFQLNRRREHKFIFSVLLFAFSMARLATLTMRIVWATRPTNTQIAIAAAILTQAGVVILFVVNLFFAERIILAYHPRLRGYAAVRLALRALVACVIAMIVMVIIVTVHSLYTLDLDARRKDRDVQLFAGTFLAVLAFLPIPGVTIAALLPKATNTENFGAGQLRTKVALLLFTSSLLSFGAGFRIGANYAAAPLSDPQWFNHKAAFYTVNFGVELIVSFAYAVSRFDRRFHVPDRAKQGKQQEDVQEADTGCRFTTEVQTETEVFGPGEDDSEGDTSKATKEQPRRDSGHSDVEKAN